MVEVWGYPQPKSAIYLRKHVVELGGIELAGVRARRWRLCMRTAAYLRFRVVRLSARAAACRPLIGIL